MISGVILAAGTSSRLGRPKQLLVLGGKPVLQHTIDSAASAGLDELIVVLGHVAARVRSAVDLPPGARAITNPEFASGQTSSLRSGLAAVDARAEAAVVLLGDQPGLQPTTVRTVVEGWRSGTAPVARAVYRGTPGHPVVIGRAAFAAFENASGDDGGRAVLADLGAEEIELRTAAPSDLDTWEHYERLRHEFEKNRT